MSTQRFSFALTQTEKENLHKVQGGLEWELIRNQIKEVRGGELPPDWFEYVIQSGLIANKIKRWTNPPIDLDRKLQAYLQSHNGDINEYAHH